MTDKLSTEKRSWNMSRIKSVDTKPELLIRKAFYKLGYRYRLHKKDLPGKPDIAITKLKLAIFVNGCFWHRHEGCNEASRPKTNSLFWENKINANINRDQKNYSALLKLDWKVLVIWECEVSKNLEKNTQLINEKLRFI